MRGMLAPSCATLALLASLAAGADARVQLPRFEARVTDLTGTLTAAQQSSLEEKLRAFEARKGAQVVVLMLPTTAPEDIAQFGIRLAEAWKVGREVPDDGAILIVAKDDRAMRIEVGRGLEGALTDALSSRIVNDTIAPLFKAGDFQGGINAGLDQMLRVIDGESLPAPDRGWQRSVTPAWAPVIFMIVLLAALLLLPRLGRWVGGALLAGVIAGGAWADKGNVPFAGGVFLVIFLFIVLTGLRSPRHWRGSSGSVFRDGSDSREGGDGEFSGGGGGSFGGGGASGRW